MTLLFDALHVRDLATKIAGFWKTIKAAAAAGHDL
jgi:hypothetical protein